MHTRQVQGRLKASNHQPINPSSIFPEGYKFSLALQSRFVEDSLLKINTQNSAKYWPAIE